MNDKTGLAAAISGFLAVALGAFAAHGLSERINAHALEVFRTGATYQFYHALALLAIASFKSQNGEKQQGALNCAALFFVIGTALFSGSLYALALSGLSWLGAITPLGGLCFLIGWGCLAKSFLVKRNEQR